MSHEEVMLGAIQIIDDIREAIEEDGIEIRSIDWKLDPEKRPAADLHILVIERPQATFVEAEFSREDLEDYPSGTASLAAAKIRRIVSRLESA